MCDWSKIELLHLLAVYIDKMLRTFEDALIRSALQYLWDNKSKCLIELQFRSLKVGLLKDKRYSFFIITTRQ